MTPRIINGCGYNLSGCTAITDFFSDYDGAGFINHEKHEIGVLKCQFGFAGTVQSAIRDLPFRATKAQLKSSLTGDEAGLSDQQLGPIPLLHLQMRARVKSAIGDPYNDLIDDVLDFLPDDYLTLDNATLLAVMDNAFSHWISRVCDLIPEHHFLDGQRQPHSFIMLKNDPPGKYPYMASMIPNGVSFSSLRDPLDACYDFNRFYGRGFEQEKLVEYCEMFNSIIRTAMHHIERFEARIQSHFYVVKFESFVSSETTRAKVLEMAGIKGKRVRELFDPNTSQKNVGIGAALPESMQTLVKDLSMPWYEQYIQFIEKRQMLIEG